MPIARINEVMKNHTGLGETGETFIVGSDSLMRSDSRFATETTILKTKVSNPAIEDALAGKSGLAHSVEYRGLSSVAFATPFEFQGAKWALAASLPRRKLTGR